VSQVRVDGYVEIPQHKWYQLLDLFTRIDEQLEVLIKQVDYTNRLLASIAGAIMGLPATPAPSQAVLSMQAIYTLAKTDTITVGSDSYQELIILYDLMILTADTDVLIAKSPDEKGFILYAGTYLALRKENERIYVKATTGNANLYISYWQVTQT
jgi:hypothetical protein